MRTTLSIDTPILDAVKRVQQKEGTSLGRVVTQLLAEALAYRGNARDDARELTWTSRPMGAQVDLADREAVYAILDQDSSEPSS